MLFSILFSIALHTGAPFVQPTPQLSTIGYTSCPEGMTPIAVPPFCV
jgi:hypothetical protein